MKLRLLLTVALVTLATSAAPAAFTVFPTDLQAERPALVLPAASRTDVAPDVYGRVPEPTTALFGLALIGVCAAARARGKAKA